MERTPKISGLRISIFLATIAVSSSSLPGQASASEPIAADKSRAETRNEFASDLVRWSDGIGLELSDNFQLDRRFIPVSCPSGYTFATSKYSNTLIEASCAEREWFRRVRVKLKNETSLAQRNGDQLQTVLILNTRIAKGEEVLASKLERKMLRQRLVPKNHVDTFPSGNQLARHDLRQGKILLDSDIYSPTLGFIAKMHIPRGTKLEPHMVTQKLIASDPGSSLATNIDSLKFFETNKPIGVGFPILNSNMRRAKLVKRGDTVVVESLGTGYEIKSTAKAAVDGYLGEQVILLSDGGRKIRAQVSDKNRAIAIK